MAVDFEALMLKANRLVNRAISGRPSNSTIGSWAGFFLFCFMVYAFFSDGDFSFLLTFAGITRAFAFMLLILRMQGQRSAGGVSLKSLQCYCCVFVLRLTSILRHEGYLPYDKSGDWLYHVVETLSLLCAGVATACVAVRFSSSYNAKDDAFGNFHIPSEFGAVFLIGPCFLAAAIFHPNLNKDWVSDVSWTFSMYLESLAIMPQLYMFQKQAGEAVETLVSHFVFALGFARIVEMAFWMSSFHELADVNGSKFVGILVLVVQFVHVALMADFFYFYAIALKSGMPMQLPTQSGLV